MAKQITIPTGVLKGRPGTITNIGDPCDICDGPCRYGNCDRCGGHSEHNVGCDTLPE